VLGRQHVDVGVVSCDVLRGEHTDLGGRCLIRSATEVDVRTESFGREVKATTQGPLHKLPEPKSSLPGSEWQSVRGTTMYRIEIGRDAGKLRCPFASSKSSSKQFKNIFQEYF